MWTEIGIGVASFLVGYYIAFGASRMRIRKCLNRNKTYAQKLNAIKKDFWM